MATTTIHRRDFIKISTLSGTGLFLGCFHTANGASMVKNLVLSGETLGTEVNQYIFIGTSGEVTLYNHRPEMGQGTFTSIPMIIAEELEVDITKVIIKQSPANRQKYGDQMVVGSRSIQGNFELMRKMGASAKEMLVQAAATKWNITPNECDCEMGMVINKKNEIKISLWRVGSRGQQTYATRKTYFKGSKRF